MIEVGQTVGNYRIIDKLGEGGMGVVFLGEHPVLGRKVAIKVIHPELSRNPEVVSRFMTEARSVSRIGNEHIVDVHDFGTTPHGEFYFVMEYLQGESVAGRLQRQQTFEAGHAMQIASQVAEALGASHASGIVHRDVKPENIFLLHRGKNRDFVKVLDFGLAKLTGNEERVSHKTLNGSVMGSPHYMSPEQCQGRSDVDHRADIYALGAVLFQMTTGSVPFGGESFGEILVKHLTEPPPSPRALNPQVSPAQESVMLRALAKKRGERFASMEDFRAAILDPEGFARGDLPAKAPEVATSASQQPGEPTPGFRSTFRGVVGELLEEEVSPPRIRVGSRLRAGASLLLAPFSAMVGLVTSRSRRPQRKTRTPRSRNQIRQSLSAPSTSKVDSCLPDGSSASDLPIADNPFAAVQASLPVNMAPWAPLIEALLRPRFGGARKIDQGVVHLAGPRFKGASKLEFFAIFIGPHIDRAAVGAKTFMAYVKPVEDYLVNLAPEARKVVIVIVDSYELGKGVREKIFDYQERHQAIVVPLYVGEIRKAEKEGNLQQLFEDRILDFHPRPNLFVRHPRKLDPTRIVGVESDVAQVVSALRDGGAFLAIHGPPGCGKSSLVRMAEFGLEQARFVVVSCAELSPLNATTVVAHLISQIEDRPIRFDTGIPDLRKSLNRCCGSDVSAKSQQGKVVLVLEDADWLVVESFAASEQAMPVHELWSMFLEHVKTRQLSVIVTGYSSYRLLERKFGAWDNPVARFARDQRVSPLPLRACHRLMADLGLGCNLIFEKRAVRLAHRASGGNVDVLMQICNRIVERQRELETDHPLTTVRIGARATRRGIEDLASNRLTFKNGIIELLGESDRAVLDLIARKRPKGLRQLQLHLPELPFAAVESALDQFKRIGLVESHGRERVAIPLLEGWLKHQSRAQPGEAEMLRRRRAATTATLATLFVVSLAFYYVLLQERYTKAGPLLAAGCAIFASHPIRIVPSQELELHVWGEGCDEPAIDLVLSTAGESILVGKDRNNGHVPVPLKCSGGRCPAVKVPLRFGTQHGPEIKAILASPADSRVSELVLSFEKDEWSAARSRLAGAFQYALAGLALFTAGFAIYRRVFSGLRKLRLMVGAKP
jgi:serine/threonine protein kinase